MQQIIRNPLRHFVFLLALLLGTSSAFALSLDEAKGRGLVGETPTGYLAPVAGNPSPAVQALVRVINAKRRARYQEIAKKNGIAVADVEKLAGKKAIEKTPPGQYVRTPSGEWVKK